MSKPNDCTESGNCAQVKKIRNAIIWLGLGIVALVYYLFVPSANQLKDLREQVQPTISLYSSPKSLQGRFPLIDDNRNTTSLSAAADGKWSLLYFGYTTCPDVCPTDLATLNQTLGMMQQADKLQVIFISVDPNRDVGKLEAFVKRFNTSFIGLSAENEALSKLTKTLGVYHEIAKTKERASQDHAQHPVDKDDGKMSMPMKEMKVAKENNYLVNHTASYLLLNPKLELTGLLTNPHRAPKMAKALDLIIKMLD